MGSLKKVAIVGAVIAIGGAGYFQFRIQDNFRQQPFYTESVRLLRGYPPALKMLGEPIVVKNLDLGDTEKTWCDGLNARLAIPLKGSLTKATLHSWASRESVKDHWVVDRLDFETSNKNWTFYINPRKRGLQEMSSLSSEIPSDTDNMAEKGTSGQQFLYLNSAAK